jgi:2'-5' RNA ligase
LEPEEKLYNFILRAKKIVSETVGYQKYLEDPPHLTLQVGSFADMEKVATTLQRVTQEADINSIYLNGWHVFRDDPLTGGNTVVTNFPDEYHIKLREIQSLVLQATRAFLNIEACFQRYSSSWEKLTPVQRASTEAWGFPFTGTDWHPHVTVASISRDHWSLVWDTLQKFSPHGVFTFPRMCLYRINQNQVSEKIAEFPFANL